MANAILGGNSTSINVEALWASNLRKATRGAEKLAEANPALLPFVEDIAVEAAVKATNGGTTRTTRPLIDAARRVLRIGVLGNRKAFRPLGNGPVELATPTAVLEAREMVEFVAKRCTSLQMKLWWHLVAEKGLRRVEAAECCRVSPRGAHRYHVRVKAILREYLELTA